MKFKNLPNHIMKIIFQYLELYQLINIKNIYFQLNNKTLSGDIYNKYYKKLKYKMYSNGK